MTAIQRRLKEHYLVLEVLNVFSGDVDSFDVFATPAALEQARERTIGPAGHDDTDDKHTHRFWRPGTVCKWR